MSLLAIKLILTPVLIAAATLAARRWGPVVGGLLAGLPLVSGPISVFLALEQSPSFAARAGRGTLLGLIALVAFCAAYARAANRFPWPVALTGGVAVYALSAWVLTCLSTRLAVTVLIVFALVCIALWIVGHPPVQSSANGLPWWDLPLRMITATALVLLITGLSGRLGATWSGLLAPFPVFTSVMAVFSHQQSGPASAQQLLRGVIAGAFATAAFYVIVELSVERLPLAMVYTLASLLAIAVNTLALYGLTRQEGWQERAIRRFGA